jgi:DNA-binding ferritin-like protein (Dps family)
MELSKKSRNFLDDLAIYLMSSGKSEHEVKDVTEELKDHLEEAERAGKDVDDVVGQSPEAYMRQLGSEMAFDVKGVMKDVVMLVPNVLAYIIIANFIQGEMTFSVVQLIGFPLVAVVFLLTVTQVFRKMSTGSVHGKIKAGLMYTGLGALPMLLFLGLMAFDLLVETPAITFATFGQSMLFGLAVLTLVIVSVWTKTWINLVIPVLLFVPQSVLSRTDLPFERQMLLSMIILFIGMGIVLFAWWKKNQQEKV